MFTTVELDRPCNNDVSDDVNIMFNNVCALFDIYIYVLDVLWVHCVFVVSRLLKWTFDVHMTMHYEKFL
jgi:hypothetical protein